MTDRPSAADLADIQGLVYRGYASHPYAGFLFARFGDDAARSRAWLDSVRAGIAVAARRPRDDEAVLHVALSASGLVALGVPEGARYGFSQELEDGMAGRRSVLGDRPETWSLGGPADRLDVVVMIYARDLAARTTQLDAHRRALVAAGAIVRDDELSSRYAQQEHFGFADGLSQPFVHGIHDEAMPGQQTVATGEVLLGYSNAYGKLPQTPRWDDVDLGRNGTYLVFRKLDQHVARFWTWIGERAKGDRAVAELLAAKLMGRWRSGASLVHTPDRDDPSYATPEKRNAFGYLSHDPQGARCPIGSHVRRANPRDARGGSAEDSELVVARHRILRRGRSYGEPLSHEAALAGRDDGCRRGLYFIGLGASIARGFEFIQQTWLSNSGFHGLFDEADPVTGPAGCAFTIPSAPLRLRLDGVPEVVTVAGGEYFFLPSLSALARIAAG